MPARPDPGAATELLTALTVAQRALSKLASEALEALPTTGDPVTQRGLDDWLERVSGTARSLALSAEALLSDLADAAALPAEVPGPGAPSSPPPSHLHLPRAPW